MAHALAYRDQDRGFFWNTDGEVGPRCANRLEDVQLVQLGYACGAFKPLQRSLLTAADIEVFKKVIPGAPYSGSASDPLSLAIAAHQVLRGGIQDRKVSPIREASLTRTYDGKHTWMLVALNNYLQNVMGREWPRLDRLEQPKCPEALRKISKRLFWESV